MPRAIGQITTAATTEVEVQNNTYTEPTSGAQRSFKSSSANDTAAGTGARTVRITYFTLASDGTIAGPFTETVALAGTAAAPTVATNIALIEKVEILTAGSGGVSAGTITMYNNAAGAGGTLLVLAAGENSTLMGHHYVSSGRQCHLKNLSALGGDAAAALFRLKSKKYKPSQLELVVAQPVAASSAAEINESATGIMIPGPSRVRATVTPTVTSQVSQFSFEYVDEVVVYA